MTTSEPASADRELLAKATAILAAWRDYITPEQIATAILALARREAFREMAEWCDKEACRWEMEETFAYEQCATHCRALMEKPHG